MPDLLGLGKEGRINTPGTKGQNWRWKLPEIWPSQAVGHQLVQLKARYNR